jgi:glutathione S-transferase kappa 1
MAVRTQVKFYYDILSPYAWFGFESLCRYQKPWDLDLQLKPMNLGKIMGTSGNTPPGMNPSKGSMLYRDVQRVSEMMDVPYKPLANFAQTVFIRGSLPTLKALAACQIMYPDHLEELTRQSWLGLYSKDIDITDKDNIIQFAEAAQIPDVDKLIEFSLGGEARQQLIDNTAEALESKCFGAPWYTVTNPNTGRREKFFGHDRIEMLGWVIGKEYMGYHPPQ